MLFRLRNAADIFEHAMNGILASVKCQFSLVYLDDIVVFSRTPRNYIAHIRRILRLSNQAYIYTKRNFFSNITDYLRHVIRQGCLKLVGNTSYAVANLESPANQTECQYFLGLYNFLHSLVPDCARLPALLKKKLRRGQQRNFGPFNDNKCAVIASLKSTFSTLPVPAVSKKDRKYTLNTSACDEQIDYMKLQ